MQRHVYQDSNLLGVIANCQLNDDSLGRRLNQTGYDYLKRKRIDNIMTYYGTVVNSSNAVIIAVGYYMNGSQNLYIAGLATVKMAKLHFINDCIDTVLEDTRIVELHTPLPRRLVDSIEGKWRIGSQNAARVTANAEQRVDFSKLNANRRIA